MAVQQMSEVQQKLPVEDSLKSNEDLDPLDYFRKKNEELSHRVFELSEDNSSLMGKVIGLQEKYSWLVDLIDEFPYSIARIDSSLRYLYVNNAYAQFYNKKKEDILSSVVRDVIGETAYSGSSPWIKKVLMGEAVRFENQATNGYGRMRYIMATYIPELDAEKRVVAFYAFLQDITEKINSLDAIQESEKRYRELIDHADDIIFTMDFNGEIKSVSPACELILGYSPEFLTGRNIASIATPRSVIEAKNELERKKRGLSPSAVHNMTFLTRDGNLVDLEIRSRTLYREGKPSHVLGIARDITDQKKSLAMIMQAKSDWEATFNTIEDVILITDINGIIQRFNKAARCRLTSVKDLLGQNISSIFFEKTVSVDDFFSLKGEIDFPNLEGVFIITSYPILDGNSDRRYLTILRDFTERKNIEQTLNSSQHLADLGELAAGIMHEIRSPLQVISGVSDTLLKKFHQDVLELPYLEEKLTSINLNAHRIKEVMSSSLDYSRSVEQELVICDLNTIVGDTLVLLRHQLQQWENMQVKTDLSPNPVIVSCWPSRISQALVNLILNAHDALTPDGWVVIRTLYGSKNCDPVLEVEDNGAGIPKDIQELIFTPFFTTKPFGKGTGLGLSNVQNIMQEHGGFINLDSVSGHGSKFSLVFPKRVK